MKVLLKPFEFEWDKGNKDKNLKKHSVTDKEAEEVFDNDPKFIIENIKHSIVEKRYQLWGETNNKRKLSVIFTIRDKKVRVISARNMNRKERKAYEKEVKIYTKI